MVNCLILVPETALTIVFSASDTDYGLSVVFHVSLFFDDWECELLGDVGLGSIALGGFAEVI